MLRGASSPGGSSRRIIQEVHPGGSSRGSSRRFLSGDSGNSGGSGAPRGSGHAGTSGNSGISGASAWIPSPIFVVFRGRSARATRLAKRRAEPSFLLAGAVLSRVRRLRSKAENPRKSTKNGSAVASRTSRVTKTWFFHSRTRLGVDSDHPGALACAPGRSF